MKIKPTKKQLEFLSWEFGVFFHFGIRSFFPGHTDWDGLEMPVSVFNPKKLDCEQWIRVSKQAGAKYAILVTKHHDGFANWPSKFSDYSVAQAPWKDGKGDVVDEFVKACRKYNMKVGLYYSPAQWTDSSFASFEKGEEYDNYFINQITELLTDYGKIDYLWFDACGSEGHVYDKKRIIKTIRTLQPEIAIFNMWDPDTRFVGNEDGYADMPNVNTVSDDDFIADENGETLRYLPAECDMKMRTEWFDCRANEDTVKSLEELMGIYDYSVGRGANLLLNIGPDSDGLLPEKDVERLIEFGKEIKRRYTHALPFGEIEKNGSRYSIKIPNVIDRVDAPLVNTVIIEEDITEGDSVKEFRIYCRMLHYKEPVCVYKGDTIGHKAICHFPAFCASEIILEIVKADGEEKINSLKAYHC